MLPEGMLSYSTVVNQYGWETASGLDAAFMLFFLSNKPCTARGQFLILEKGAQKILHICLTTRELLKTSSANHLILVP